MKKARKSLMHGVGVAVAELGIRLSEMNKSLAVAEARARIHIRTHQAERRSRYQGSMEELDEQSQSPSERDFAVKVKMLVVGDEGFPDDGLIRALESMVNDWKEKTSLLIPFGSDSQSQGEGIALLRQELQESRAEVNVSNPFLKGITFTELAHIFSPLRFRNWPRMMSSAPTAEEGYMAILQKLVSDEVSDYHCTPRRE